MKVPTCPCGIFAGDCQYHRDGLAVDVANAVPQGSMPPFEPCRLLPEDAEFLDQETLLPLELPITITLEELSRLRMSMTIPNCMAEADNVIFRKVGVPADELRVNPEWLTRHEVLFVLGQNGQLFWRGWPISADGTFVPDREVHWYLEGKLLVILQVPKMRSDDAK